MPYLICKKCGGHYKLKEGESPENPQNLRFWDMKNEVFVYFESCECGGELKYVQNFNSRFERNHSNFIKEHSAKETIITISSIIAGILVVLIPQLLIFNENYALLLLVLGGLVSSLTVKNNDVTLNAAIVGLVAGLILLIFRSNITFSNEMSYFVTLEMVGPLLILLIFGVFGGLINIFVRFLISKYR